MSVATMSEAREVNAPRYEHIDVVPLSGALGAEVSGVDASRPLPAPVFAEVHRAWLRHHVICFRDQRLTPEQHLAFAEQWGDIHIHPFNKPLDDHPQILEILKTPEMRLNNGGRWHSDQMYTPQPAKATILFAREMPPTGGDTLFSNAHLAYDRLSDGLRHTLGMLRAVNNGDSRKHPTGLTRRERAAAGVATMPQIDPGNVQTVSTHPVIRTHPETGRKSLYIGGHTERFEGMTEEESAPLLRYLMDHATRPEFVCRLRWAVGTLTMWDNRSTQHFAINDYHGFRRCVHKITVCGDAPVGDAPV